MKVLSGVIVLILGLFFASFCAHILVNHFFLGNKFGSISSVFSDTALAIIFGFVIILGIAMVLVGATTLWESFRRLTKH